MRCSLSRPWDLPVLLLFISFLSGFSVEPWDLFFVLPFFRLWDILIKFLLLRVVRHLFLKASLLLLVRHLSLVAMHLLLIGSFGLATFYTSSVPNSDARSPYTETCLQGPSQEPNAQRKNARKQRHIWSKNKSLKATKKERAPEPFEVEKDKQRKTKVQRSNRHTGLKVKRKKLFQEH